MSRPKNDASIFAVGGAVQASNGIYLSRAADEELLALCRAGDFGYVLTPRQLGKTSLMVRTARRLGEEGVRSAIIDLTEIGVEVKAEEWFLGLLVKMEDELLLKTSALRWWAERGHQAPTQRLTAFFKEVLLKEVEGRVVVFVDEIDTTLGLSFTDDFYAAIRSLYNARAHTPEFRRLSFVLIGVATPGDLIRDPQRTPFNIGQRVDLTDFTYEEALPLAAGFQLGEAEAQRVLGWVLRWTGGHPYLTQRLCRTIAEESRTGWTEEDVARVVSATFFGEMSEKDNNIQFVRDMLTKRAPDHIGVLTTFREVLRRPVIDEEQSVIKSHLKLSGVVRRDGRLLLVRNPIYRTVFDKKWVSAHLPVNWLRILTRVAASILITLMLLSIPLAIYAWSQKAEAESQKNKAELALLSEQGARQRAEASEKEARALGVRAEAARTEALRQKGEAEQARSEAEAARTEALKQKEAAEQARAQAMHQAHLARASELDAQAARAEAVKQKGEAERLGDIALRDDLGLQAQLRRIGSSSLLNDSVLLARESMAQFPPAPTLIDYQILSSGLMLMPRHVAAPGVESGHVVHASFINEGKRILTVISNGPLGPKRSYTVRMFDSASGQEVDSLHRTFANIALDQQGRYLAALDFDGEVSVTDLEGGNARAAFKLGTGEPQKLPSALSVSSDGKHVALVGPDGVRVKTLDGKDEGDALPMQQKQSQEVVTSAYLSPNGKLIVLVSDDAYSKGTSWVAEVFDVASSKTSSNSRRSLNTTIDTIPDSVPEVSDRVQFSGDGRYLAIAGSKSVNVYATNNFEKAAWGTPVTEGSQAHITFSTDSQWLAVTTPDGIKLLSTFDGAEQIIPSSRGDRAEAVSFGPDGKSMATKYNGNTVRVWRWNSGPLREVARIIRQADVAHVELSSDGKYLLTADADAPSGNSEAIYTGVSAWASSRLNVWDLSPDKSFMRRTLAESVDATVLSSDKKYIMFTTSASGETTLWKVPLDTGVSADIKLMRTHATARPTLKAECDSEAPMSTSSAEALNSERVLKAEGDSEVPVFSFDARHMAEIKAAGVEDSGTRVLVSDVDSGISKKLCLGEKLSYPIAVSLDGKYFAASQINGDPVVFEVATGNRVASVADQTEDTPSILAFSPDGAYLALSGPGGGGLVWDLRENRVVTRFGPQGVEGQLLFSASGKYLVSVGSEVRLWMRGAARPIPLAPEQVPTQTAAARPIPNGDADRGPASGPRRKRAAAPAEAADATYGMPFFSADERYVAVVRSDNVVRVWETATGRLVSPFKHEDDILSVALSADGGYLATLSEDGFTRVWKVDGKVMVAILPRLSPPYEDTGVAFSTDGKYLLTSCGGESGAVQMWLWQPKNLLALSCELLPVGDPTPRGWGAYLSDSEDLVKYILSKPHDHCPGTRCTTVEQSHGCVETKR